MTKPYKLVIHLSSYLHEINGVGEAVRMADPKLSSSLPNKVIAFRADSIENIQSIYGECSAIMASLSDPEIRARLMEVL
jgi:hypothetical protein